MTPDTARLVRMCLSSLVAGAMGVGSNLLSAMAGTGEVPKGAITIAVITGGLLAAKDLQSYLATPPTEPLPLTQGGH